MIEFLAADLEQLAVKFRQLLGRARRADSHTVTARIALGCGHGLVTATWNGKKLWAVTPCRDANDLVTLYTDKASEGALYLVQGIGIPYQVQNPDTYCGVTTPHHLYTFPKRYQGLTVYTNDDQVVYGVQVIADDRQAVLLNSYSQPFGWVPLDCPLHLYVKGRQV